MAFPTLATRKGYAEPPSEGAAIAADRGQLANEPLGVLRKGCGAAERTEVVRLLFHQQAPDRPLGINRHLAHGIQCEATGALVQANGGENLYGLGDVP
jgi:hypothetical protein